MLIDHGADLGVSNDLPICLVARSNLISWLKILIDLMIEKCADITYRNNLQITLATESGFDLEIIQYLVLMGANPLLYNKKVLYDAFFCNKKLIPYLIDLCIYINKIDSSTVQ